MNTQITLSQGNGGAENNELIKNVFYQSFCNPILDKNEDAAVIDGGRLAFSTDSFTVNPIFFSGGDIGKLSVCGTCNDLAMMGAKPTYLSLGVIIEEGFSLEHLQRITDSIAHELQINDASIVSGDTKVVPKGSVDGIFINTSGIGYIQKEGISSQNIADGDCIIVSNSIGKHGAAIFANREGIDIQSSLQSDCASLWPSVASLIDAQVGIKSLRDATRGGLAAVLNEWALSSGVCIEVQEQSIPVCDEVRGICELLGFDASFLANEGTFVLAVDKNDVQKTLEVLRHNPLTQEAAMIGYVSKTFQKKVVLKTQWGTTRFLEMPTGELLPRIC